MIKRMFLFFTYAISILSTSCTFYTSSPFKSINGTKNYFVLKHAYASENVVTILGDDPRFEELKSDLNSFKYTLSGNCKCAGSYYVFVYNQNGSYFRYDGYYLKNYNSYGEEKNTKEIHIKDGEYPHQYSAVFNKYYEY